MDILFHVNEAERASLLQHIIHSYGCTYICLWSHFSHPTKYLYFMDGLYHEDQSTQASSSMRAFSNYQKSVFFTDNSNGTVPGFAFKNNLPFMELKDLELLRRASISSQLQFYQEARIKTAIFMGCKSGEIELGMSSDPQVNMEMEMKKLFPDDFSREATPQQVDQARASSSSSSLRSLSMDNSPEYSPFIFNMLQSMPGTYAPKEAAPLEQAPNPVPSTYAVTIQDPVEEALSQIRSRQLMHTRESEEAAMTKAILAVITSTTSSASPSSSGSSHQVQTPRRPSAFRSFRSSLQPTNQISTRNRSRQNLIKRSISFFKSLNIPRDHQGQMMPTTRPTSNQLHHMISERRRREKLNESFQALRSILPPGSKRDKASVLSNTTAYLTSLKSQVEELRKRNQMLEAQLSQKVVPNQASSAGLSSERLNVGITDAGESTSDARVVDLEVNARGESIILDLVIRVLEFLKQVENVTVMSIEAETRVVETNTSANRVLLRLRIQGGDWDQSSFQEAVRRVVDDLAQ